ncbi:MAG: hypothetical protein RBS80_11420 [Thermoguttaceae bacterium]|nr:hypothetical protein [Thermoguttaceae bacterium]
MIRIGLSHGYASLEQGIELLASWAVRDADILPTYGARQLERVIQQRIQNPLAIEMLKGDFHEGACVQVDYRDGEFTFG